MTVVERIQAATYFIKRITPLIRLVVFVLGLLCVTVAAFCFAVWLGFVVLGGSFLVLERGLDKWQAS